MLISIAGSAAALVLGRLLEDNPGHGVETSVTRIVENMFVAMICRRTIAKVMRKIGL